MAEDDDDDDDNDDDEFLFPAKIIFGPTLMNDNFLFILENCNHHLIQTEHNSYLISVVKLHFSVLYTVFSFCVKKEYKR